MQFTKKKSFGQRISLTEKQIEKLQATFNAAGLTCFVENCHTGSCYVAVGLPAWEQNIRGEWYTTLDCGCGDDVAKIRLSGHDEGRRQDSTHCVVGTKGECLASLKQWVAGIIAEHSHRGLEILSNVPSGPMAS